MEGGMEALGRLLQEAPSIEALWVAPGQRRLAVASLGLIDLKDFSKRLTETLALLDEEWGRDATVPMAPRGLQVRRLRDGVLLEKPSCPTAPSMWQWRDVPWPEPAAVRSGPGAQVEEEEDWRVLAALAGVCGVLGLGGFLTEHLSAVPGMVPTVLYALALVAGGWDACLDVLRNLRSGKLDIHFLMLAVAVGAASIGAWAEGALLLFLFSFSGALEHFALHRTRREIDALFRIAPKEALLVVGETEREVPVESLQPGDRIRVKPGSLFPVDGQILSGRTAADEANLTGESTPVTKEKGDTVLSGTMNLWGSVEASVLRPAAESSLQKIIHLIREAQHLKAPSQRFTDKFGTRYTYAILGLTGTMFLVWWLGFGISPFLHGEEGFSAFYRAMTLLVVASPCALVISIPSAILASIAWGARHGILFRGGAAVERLAEVDTVALDKTGTLTTGELQIEAIESLPPGREREVIELAYALERKANHPIARAITQFGVKEDLPLREVQDFRSVTGQGVSGGIEGAAQTFLGRREMMERGPLADLLGNVPPPDPFHTEVWVLCEGLVGRILLKDRVRTESRPVLDAIRALGLRPFMLTGDREGPAFSIAQTIGLRADEVRAGLRPEDKVEAIRKWTGEGARVAMVGDGVNDAPSLAAAHVSVAMGARGSDAALEQSEVILMNDRIDHFLHAYQLSRAARRVIRQNLVVALGTVLVMVAAALGGLIPLSVGVFAHEGSTVLVCLNSLRLLFLKVSPPSRESA